MTPWGEIWFKEGDTRGGVLYPHYQVSAGKQLLGIILGKEEYKGKWVAEESLEDRLVFQKHGNRCFDNAMVMGSFFRFRNLAQAKRYLTRAYNLVQIQRTMASFKRDPKTGKYSVFHKGLEIGKIEPKKKIPSQKIPEPTHYQYGYEQRYYVRFRLMTELEDYWLLDKDICSFLKIPHDTHPNCVSLNGLKNFICMRLMNDSQSVCANDLIDIQHIEHVNGADLESVIYFLTHHEKLRRGRWIRKTTKIYP